jgi:hypothetical protein
MQQTQEETSGQIADQKFIITDDGAIVDPESGEILGYQDAPLISDDPVPDDVDPAVVKRHEKELVEFYLERRARANARKTGLESEMNLLIAGIQERFETMVKEQERKIAFLDGYYGDVASKYTEAEIGELAAKVKNAPKSIKLAYGTMGFRASKGKTDISDHERAAYTLIEAGVDTPLRFTIDVADLKENGNEKEARYVLETLKDLIDPEFQLEDIEDPDSREVLKGVKVFPGVKVQVMAGLLPDKLPEGVEGITRQMAGSPLGKFYIDHGGKK